MTLIFVMNIMTKIRWRNLRELNPLWWALISWTLTIGGYGLGEIMIRSFGWNPRVQGNILFILIIVAGVAPLLALSILLLSYRRNAQSLGRIIGMFLALVLLCANINFLLMLHFGRDAAAAPFHGIHSVWGDPVDGRPPPLDFGNVFLSAVDCLHFSVITLSTVGYGDIYPTAWYSKLIVDVEILLGLGITILTIGRHFSRRENKAAD